MTRTWTCLQCGEPYTETSKFSNPFYCGEQCDAEATAEWIAKHRPEQRANGEGQIAMRDGNRQAAREGARR